MDTLLLENASEWELRCLAGQLDRTHVGVMLLAGDARVLRANRIALELLRAARGLALGSGRLISTIANGAYILRELERALASGREVWLPVEREMQAPLSLLMRPVQARAALAIVSEPDRQPVAPEAALRQLFGFTASEARIASRLAHGIGIARIAYDLGVQPNTCRSHLKAAYAKTGTRCQSQLAVLVATSVAVA